MRQDNRLLLSEKRSHSMSAPWRRERMLVEWIEAIVEHDPKISGGLRLVRKPMSFRRRSATRRGCCNWYYEPAGNNHSVGSGHWEASRSSHCVAESCVGADCERLKEDGLETEVRRRTGLLIDPYFSATKIMHLFEKYSGLRDRCERGEVLFGTVDSFLIWRLTGGRVHATDVTNASRTLF